MEIKARLTAINSKADMYGNCYYAFEYHDYATGKVIQATISGGESNIYNILLYTGAANDWDRSILFNREELPIRKYNRLVKDWVYAGCDSKSLADYIKGELAK